MAESKMGRPLGDDAQFMLELFDARPVRTVEQLKAIFEDAPLVHRCLNTLKKRGEIAKGEKLGEWGRVQ